MNLIKSDDCLLLVIDLQEKLFPNICEKERLVEKIAAVGKGLAACGAPRIVTEQYPKGLGPTVAELAFLKEGAAYFEKTSFSSWGAPGLEKNLRESGRPQIVLCGIETHVCVLQTAMDLLAAGFQVFVPADCVGSRRMEDRDTALRRMASAGIVVTCLESVLFEALRDAKNPQFKTVMQFVK